MLKQVQHDRLLYGHSERSEESHNILCSLFLFDFDAKRKSETEKEKHERPNGTSYQGQSPRTPKKEHVITRKDNEQIGHGLEQSDVVILNTGTPLTLYKGRWSKEMAINNSANGEKENNMKTLIDLKNCSLAHLWERARVRVATHVDMPPTKAKFAFTLAEVLITLGIIGVVVAMTIPTLQARIQEKRYTTQYKKIFSELNQAMLLLQEDESLPSTLCAENDSECFRDKLASKLKVSHVCDDAVPNKCQAISEFLDKKSNGASMFDPNSELPSLVTLSGYTVKFKLDDCSTGICGKVFVDTNGLSRPNVVGKDEFYLIATEKNFIPVYKGDDKLTDCYKGTGISCSSVRINGGGSKVGGSKICHGPDYDVEYCCDDSGCWRS